MRLRNVRLTKGVFWGEADSLLEASPDRTEPPCDVFGVCGGCTWLHFAYPPQSGMEEAYRLRLPETHWRHRHRDDLWKTVSLRLGYRTRAEFNGDGTKYWLHGAWSHDVVDLAACPLCHPKLNTALGLLRQSEPTCSVELTVNPDGDEVLAWTKAPNSTVRRFSPWRKRKETTRRSLILSFDGVSVVNGTFSQSSLLLNRVLLRVVREELRRAPRARPLLRQPTSSAALPTGVDVSGLDHNRAVVEAANTVRAGAYRVGSEKPFLPCAAYVRLGFRASWILRVPGQRPLRRIRQRPTRVALYMFFCDPATLARDAKAIVQAGWTIARVTAVDMFPNTAHVETVCVFRERLTLRLPGSEDRPEVRAIR